MAMKKSAPKKAAAKKPIAINPANAGKLRATAKAKSGKKIPAQKLAQLAKSPNKKTAARAQFAINAAKWSHKKKS